MNVTITRKNKAVHFEAQNADGNTVHFDGSQEVGGEGKGVRPMEGVLMSLASCSAIDVVDMLKKMRQELEDIQIDVKGERRDEIPKVFTKIHLAYRLKGDIHPDKAERAVKLSAEKYCSVSKMLEPDVEITYSVEME